MPARFVCFTPYHLLLAETLAEQLDLAGVEVVFTDESGLGDAVDRAFTDSRLRLSGRLTPIGTSAGWRRWSVYVTNRRAVRSWARNRRPDALYLFNPLRPEARAIADRVATSLHFVEDGIEAYVDGARPSLRNQTLRRAASLTMGVPYFPGRNFIAFDGWTEAWALLPEHVFVPPGVTAPPIRAIDHTVLATVIDRWRTRAGLHARVEACDVLLMLDHPDVADGLTVERAVRIARAWGVDADRVLVKPHPRDARPVQALLDGYPIEAIAARWPVEIALGSLSPGAVLVGGSSTGMLTAAVLRPDLALRLRARPGAPLHQLLTSLGARVRLEALDDA